MSDQTFVLPILGMTCTNCSAAVERSIRKEPGVVKVSVNLSTEKATVEATQQTVVTALIDRVRRAGYDVALGEASFLIENMSDNNDALVIEKGSMLFQG
jgi:P-type Cu+ transporter